MIAIREMSQADLDQVCLIENETFSLPWSYTSFSETVDRADTIYLVAEEKGRILGYLGIWKSLDEGEITNVAVKEEFRRRGIGRLLLSNALDIAGKTGIMNLVLEVRFSNLAAIRLYESMGFENVGVRPDFYERPREDAIIMWHHMKSGLCSR